MDKRTLLAVAICFLIFMGWQKFYIEPRLPKTSIVSAPVNATDATTAAPAAGTTITAPGANSPVIVNAAPSQELDFKTSVSHGKIGNAKKFFTDFTLDQFNDTHQAVGTKVKMLSVTPEVSSQVELAFDSTDFTYLNGVSGKLTQNGNVAEWTFEDERVILKRIYNFDPNVAYVNVTLNAKFKTAAAPKVAFVSLESGFPEKDPEEQDRQILVRSMGSLERKHHKDIKAVEDIPAPVEWIGAQNRYFLMSLIPNRTADVRALAQAVSGTRARVSLVFPIAGNEWNEVVKVYFGPKEVEVLKSVSPTLTQTVDFGFFTAIATPILLFMKWLYTILGNWGLAIILLTLVIKIATFPLTYKSMKSMKRMSKMQPELEKVRARYKDKPDKEAMNREIMQFMKDGGYNPISGCMPILIQMPVFFALYRVLYSSIELYQSPFYFWIHDLSLRDPYYVTPVILTGVMWLQQKLTPNTATDPMQVKMMQFMPLLFGFMMMSLPAGLTIYMLVNALASIGQQLFINARLKEPVDSVTVLAKA